MQHSLHRCIHLFYRRAKHECKCFPCEIGISVIDDSINAGDYEFIIYAWKYVGLLPDIKLMAVVIMKRLSERVLNFMQYASDYEFDDGFYIL